MRTPNRLRHPIFDCFYGAPFLVVVRIFVLAVLLTRTASAEDVNHIEKRSSDGWLEVVTRVTPAKAQVAERITLNIVVEAPEGTQVAFPEPPQTLGELHVVDAHEVDDIPTEQGRQWMWVIELESFLSGDLLIPSIAFSYTTTRSGERHSGTASSDPVTIHVNSVLEPQAKPEVFRDTKEFVAVRAPASRNHLATAIGAVCFLAAAAAWVWFVRNRKNRSVSPERWALEEIDRLKSMWQNGTEMPAHEFYTRLTDIVRMYIELRYNVAALHMTTGDFFRHVQRQEDLQISPEQATKLKDFLRQADIVKFGGLVPSPGDVQAAIMLAREFVMQTSRQTQQATSSAQEKSEGHSHVS